MNKAKLTFIFIFGIAIGFVTGFRSGAQEFVLWYSQYEAGKLTRELKQLRSGEYSALIQDKEFDLNLQFYLHGMYLDSLLGFLIPYEEGRTDRRMMENAVSYRKDNPYALKDLSLDQNYKNSGDAEFLSNLHKGYEIQKTQIEKVQKIYAK